ncbi:MAG TPA: MGMT family protein [Bacillaceae bacterium]|nr:MGMT family protein [Bacillaceae bacterium]
MQLFTKEVISILKEIPQGKVVTYGQISKLAGNPRGARQVSRILHSMSEKHSLPWHRVVNAKGEIVIANPEIALQQKLLLESEGVELINDKRVDLSRYQVGTMDE